MPWWGVISGSRLPTGGLILQCGGLDTLTRVTSEQMFSEDETVKLAVVAAVRSVCAEYTESFV